MRISKEVINEEVAGKLGIQNADVLLKLPYMYDLADRKLSGQEPLTYVQWLATQARKNGPEWEQQRLEEAKALPMRGC